MTLDNLEGFGNVMVWCHLCEEGLLEKRLGHAHRFNCSGKDRFGAVRPERTPKNCEGVVVAVRCMSRRSSVM